MKLAFVVPVHGRFELATACLRQLARTCDALTAGGVEATAVVAGEDPLFERLAGRLGFTFVRAANRPLGMKWNDGFVRACLDGATHVAPFGSDDVIDAALILSAPLPPADTIRCARLSAVVAPQRDRIAVLRIPYRGGDGVRIMPAALLERVGYRPCGEENGRAIDGSIVDNLHRRTSQRPTFVYHDLHELQIVDFKSPALQRNSYDACLEYAIAEYTDVHDRLAVVYPEFLEELAAVERRQWKAAA